MTLFLCYIYIYQIWSIDETLYFCPIKIQLGNALPDCNNNAGSSFESRYQLKRVFYAIVFSKSFKFDVQQTNKAQFPSHLCLTEQLISHLNVSQCIENVVSAPQWSDLKSALHLPLASLGQTAIQTQETKDDITKIQSRLLKQPMIHVLFSSTHLSTFGVC